MAVYVNGKKVAGRGISGKSPYQIAVLEGYTGTEQDFNTQLGAIGDAVAGFNELSQQVDNAKNEVEAAVNQAQIDIGTAVDKANNALSSVEQAKTDIENTVSDAKDEIEQAKQDAIDSIPNAENLMTAVWSYGATAPDTGYSGDEAEKKRKLFWIDSNTSTGGLKYYNKDEDDWVHVPVAWA